MGECKYCAGWGVEYVDGSSLSYRCPDCDGTGYIPECEECGKEYSTEYCEDCYARCCFCEGLYLKSELHDDVCDECYNSEDFEELTKKK
jgi:hypothetical protein